MTNMIRQFLRQEAAGGLILIFAATVALFMANSPLFSIYQSFLDVPVSVKIASLDISKPLLLWINDGLMAIFFLVVGLEVKRELIEGSLAGRDKAVFPAIAALGGMLAPALIYLLFNGADEVTRQGWAIPAATDIAFDEIHKLYFSLKPEYRSNAVWVMNDETALGLRDLKDSTGNYLWSGAADTLLGKPVVISTHMHSAASGKKPVTFGDFKYYWIAQRQPLSVRALHEKYLFANKIGYFGMEILDGCLIRSEAIKALQMAE